MPTTYSAVQPQEQQSDTKPWVELIEGDCRDVLKTLPDQSVNCIVTSPPYFGLRDYGHKDQIGLEPTPEEFVRALVGVLCEARRVLRDDGTLWLNLGDSYSAQSGAQVQGTKQARGSQKGAWGGESRKGVPGLKPKDLIGIPWRVAFALQADGWYLRQDIIWHKPNPMPESVRDRCTKAHEYLFLLSKSPRYYFDAATIREDATTNAKHKHWTEREHDQTMLAAKQANGVKGRPRGVAGYVAPGKRNRRSVWTIATQPFRGAHFATMPEAVAEPCILAGCPVGGVVLNPFGGSGTVGVVARRHGRSAILIELNPTYYDIASARLWPEEFGQ